MIGALVERVRTSAWTTFVLRAFATSVALVVLAAIGHRCAGGEPLARAEPAAFVPNETDEGGAPPAPAPAPAPVAAAPAPPTPASRGRATAEDPVYVNEATIDELERLPGVGPKRAAAILALRQKVGRFRRVEDLLRVKGVGRTALRKWRPLVRLDAPALSDGGAP